MSGEAKESKQQSVRCQRRQEWLRDRSKTREMIAAVFRRVAEKGSFSHSGYGYGYGFGRAMAGFRTVVTTASEQGSMSITDFAKSIGGGLEAHVEKMSSITDLGVLLRTRSRKLKELGLPCKQRKLLLRHIEQYKQGLWTPKRSP